VSQPSTSGEDGDVHEIDGVRDAAPIVRADEHPGLAGPNLALLALGVIGVSLSGPLMAAATSVSALAMSLWRTGLGALAMAPVGLTRDRRQLLALPRRAMVRSCFAGLMLAAHFAAWTGSLKLTSVASATALVSLQAAWVVVLSRLAGVSATARVWSGLALALVGVLVISGVDLSVSTRTLSGDMLAFAGGAFAAVYTIVGGRVRREASTATYTLLCYATAALALLLASLLAGVHLTGFPLRGWLLILAVTLAAQLCGHSVFNHLLATLSPTLVSMALLLEVPGAALLAAVLLGQAPPVAVYGGLVLICAGLGVVVSARRIPSALTAPTDQ
jgi:drug/metabolite transporter (DMT)-like permease